MLFSAIKEIINGEIDLFGEEATNVQGVGERIEETLWNQWKTHQSTKSDWYNVLKKERGLEPYLMEVGNPQLRNCLTRFRLGSHWLQVEKGRWSRKGREERVCLFCKERGIIVVEDEYHMLKMCPSMHSVREEFAELDVENRSIEDVLMNSRTTVVAKFLARCEAVRSTYEMNVV